MSLLSKLVPDVSVVSIERTDFTEDSDAESDMNTLKSDPSPSTNRNL